MENQNDNVTFVIGVLTQTGIKFGTAITSDGRVAKSQALLDLAVKEGLPRLRISSNGKVTFLSAKDAFNAGRMKKLGKDYEDLTGTYEGSTPAEIVSNMIAGNHKDETSLSPEMLGDIDNNFISF